MQSLITRRAQVLLLGGNASITGYAAQGSLYTGAGYWAPVPDLAAALADMSVRSCLCCLLHQEHPACSL